MSSMGLGGFVMVDGRDAANIERMLTGLEDFFVHADMSDQLPALRRSLHGLGQVDDPQWLAYFIEELGRYSGIMRRALEAPEDTLP